MIAVQELLIKNINIRGCMNHKRNLCEHQRSGILVEPFKNQKFNIKIVFEVNKVLIFIPINLT